MLAAHPGQQATTVGLGAAQAIALASALRQDALDGIYSAALSIAEAVQALDRRMYSWSTVKLYYSTFYLARASLGLAGVAIVYVKTTPFTWEAIAGRVPKKESGTTHKATLGAFARLRPTSVLLSQLIVADDPFDWLMGVRELVNYKLPRFSEPTVPDCFQFVERAGVRRLLVEYVVDTTHRYTFDPDHAMLAFPVAALRETIAQLKAVTGRGLLPTDLGFVSALCCDRQGPIAEMRRLLEV